jgi:outer membrane receptor protein involved in Fe transport
MKNRLGLWRTVAAATLLSAAAPGLALAQDNQTAASDEAGDNEIVVTARKREESKQDVPISVTAFTAQALEDRQITSTADLAAFTPGFAFNEGFGRDGDRPVIRGAANILITDGKVGTFVDGAPVLGDTSGIDLESFERVEVIKGPQSAVFGRGTLSGAINYVSRRPGDDARFKIEATAGNWGRADLFFSADGPVPIPGADGRLKGSFTYKSYNFDGDYNNALALGGEKLSAQFSETVNMALFFEPTEELDMSVRYIKAKDDDAHFAVRLLPASANNCFLTTRPTFCGTVQLPEQHQINVGDIFKPGLERDTERLIFDNNLELFGGALNLAYQATVYSQSEISGYDQSYDGRTFQISPAFGACAIPVPNRRCGFSPFNDTTGFNEHGTTHELRLESSADQAVRWRVGYFRLDRNRKNDLRFIELTVGGGDPAGSRSTTETDAFFGGVDWDITPDLKLGVEMRQQRDRIADLALAYRVGDIFPVAPSGTLSFTPTQVVGNTTNAPEREQVFESTLPRVTLDYRLNDDVLVYGQYAVGNAPGGFNTAGAPQATFDEETLTNYEVGVKTELFGFNYLNLAAFFIEYEDQVLTTNFASTTAVQSYNTNLGVQEITGFEFEAQRELFDGFTVTGTMSYVDGEFTEGTDPQQALFRGGGYCTTSYIAPTFSLTGTTGSILPTTPAVTGSPDIPANTSCATLGSIVGKKSPLVPPLQASLATRYERDWSAGVTFFIGADITYRDSFYAQVDNLQETGSAAKLNAQVGLEGESWKLALWGKNLNNEDTPEGILRYVDFLGALPASPGFRGTPRAFAVAAPRKPAVGVTLSYNW